MSPRMNHTAFRMLNGGVGRCHYCKRDGVSLTRDHVIARARGGTNSYQNLVPSCVNCNRRKADHLPDAVHLNECLRCSDAVEYHWIHLLSLAGAERVRKHLLVASLYPGRRLPHQEMPTAYRIRPYGGWDPRSDDYPELEPGLPYQ